MPSGSPSILTRSAVYPPVEIAAPSPAVSWPGAARTDTCCISRPVVHDRPDGQLPIEPPRTSTRRSVTSSAAISTLPLTRRSSTTAPGVLTTYVPATVLLGFQPTGTRAVSAVRNRRSGPVVAGGGVRLALAVSAGVGAALPIEGAAVPAGGVGGS